ncbi:helix-turn-helix domain-containing protein [Halomonas sp. SSL-5]|uniref:helix-turn-helix domain-containing protein n=1 Tax=Halomonas sp. SSL-5 TaxID=3065855 RepID=UPI00273871C8|nr:helix-turn-helix domain-containing protein [Halomonas sp. SSL-5]MDY7114768.1 helix-turn-helix domain-containing protein [Halomonas sp. SSL-5]
MSTNAVPVFKLYGETHHWPTPDLLHWESIPERSRLHDWKIHPHRHTDLLHLLHLSAGRVRLELEGSQRCHEAPLIIVVPAMSIHGFRFSPDTQGHIITLASPLAERLEERLGTQAGAMSLATAYPLDAARPARRIATLVDQLGDEYRSPAPGRERILEAFTEALFIEISRLADKRITAGNTKLPHPQDRGLAHLQNYQALIEKQFRQQPSIEKFAEQLGMTSAHLNLLCRRLANRSALQLLHERLLLEAKRQLTYTNMTVGQVADSLGFSEPAYFTRFFKRLTGLAPRDFRRRQPEA